MTDGLDEGARLGEVVGHERRETPVPDKRSDDVAGDLLLRHRNYYTGEATKST